MTEPRAILFSQMQPPLDREGEFHTWYDTDHIPARMVLPGFRSARRLVAVDGYPKYLVVYELEDLTALDTSVYQELKRAPSTTTTEMLSVVEGFTRFTCVEVGAAGTGSSGPYLYVSAFCVPRDEEERFERWYEEERVPQLLQTEGCLGVRWFKVVDGAGGDWTHLALHDMASPVQVVTSYTVSAGSGFRPSWFRTPGEWLYMQLGAEHVAQ